LTTFVFNADGIAALNLTRGGLFAAGGVMSLSSLSPFNGIAFETGLPTDVRALAITIVPEPTSVVLIATGVTIITAARRRAARSHPRNREESAG
jgi:hypothetical protein